MIGNTFPAALGWFNNGFLSSSLTILHWMFCLFGSRLVNETPASVLCKINLAFAFLGTNTSNISWYLAWKYIRNDFASLRIDPPPFGPWHVALRERFAILPAGFSAWQFVSWLEALETMDDHGGLRTGLQRSRRPTHLPSLSSGSYVHQPINRCPFRGTRILPNSFALKLHEFWENLQHAQSWSNKEGRFTGCYICSGFVESFF